MLEPNVGFWKIFSWLFLAGPKMCPSLWLEGFSLPAGKWSLLAQRHNSSCLWPEMPSQSTQHNLFVVHMWMHNRNKCFVFVVTFPVGSAKVSRVITLQNRMKKPAGHVVIVVLGIKPSVIILYPILLLLLQLLLLPCCSPNSSSTVVVLRDLSAVLQQQRKKEDNKIITSSCHAAQRIMPLRRPDFWGIYITMEQTEGKGSEKRTHTTKLSASAQTVNSHLHPRSRNWTCSPGGH